MSVKKERRLPSAESRGAAVGRLVDCSQADDRRLIRLVRERRVLYARNNNMPVAIYYNQVKRLWLEVADKMGWTVADVRRKWSHIRNSYSRHLRNEMFGVRTGRGRMVSKWYLADELDFLRQHMATDTRRALRHSCSPVYVREPVAATQSCPSLDGTSTPWFALGSTSHVNPTQLSAESQPFCDNSSSPHSFEPDENSAYFHFFRGIHNDYQELPAKKQRLFRRECLAFLHRLLDEEEPRGQEDALDLSNSIDTDDEKECKPIFISNVESIVGDSDSTQECVNEAK